MNEPQSAPEPRPELKLPKRYCTICYCVYWGGHPFHCGNRNCELEYEMEREDRRSGR